MIDFYQQVPFWGGAGRAGENISDAADSIAESIRRKRQLEMEQRRQDELERHQLQQETNSSDLAKIAEKRQLAAEDFTRQQSALANRSQASRDARDQLTFDQAQADRRQKTVRDIGGLFGKGLPAQAQAEAGASQFVNPRTGQMEGVKLEALPVPPGPGPAPVEPKPPEFVGPLEDPEEARMRAMGRVFGNKTGEINFDPDKAPQADQEGNAAVAEVQRQQALRDQFGKDQEAFPAAQQSHAAAAAAHSEAAANPQYRASFPGGESVTIDPREERKAIVAEAKDKADRLRQGATTQPPDVAKAMLLQADLIESTISNADKAPVTNMNSAVQAQGFKAGESDKDRALKREQVRAKAMGKGLGAGGKARLAGMAELIKMKEGALGPNGEILDPHINSKIAARAAELGIPATGKGGWGDPVKEVIRGGVAADRQAERHAALDITGPNGEAGTAKSPTEAKTLNNKNAAFAQVKARLQALQADVAENGTRVLMPDATQRRNSLMNAANAALRVYNGLGGTDASQRMEAEISGAAGTLGHGLFVGANPGVLGHLLTEAEAQHRANMQIRTRAPAGDQPAPAGAHPSGDPVGTVKDLPNGQKIRKVGPNNWQPVAP